LIGNGNILQLYHKYTFLILSAAGLSFPQDAENKESLQAALHRLCAMLS